MRRATSAVVALAILAGAVGALTRRADASPVRVGRGTVTRSGASLMLNGRPYRFTGVNAYEAATLWGTNAGCGAMLTDAQLDGLFASLRPGSIVRIWGWQGSMATHYSAKTRDWTGLDRVVNAAARRGQRLIISLTDQAGTCDDGHWKDVAWYTGGYRSIHDDDGRGLTISAYWDYVREVVRRYAWSPAIAMWEPVNEAEAAVCAPGLRGAACWGHATCDESAAAAALRSFFDVVGAEIRRLDPGHLVESGLIGGGQCGTQGANYQTVHESPGIDVASYHDYGSVQPLPGDQWNGFSVRVAQMRAARKPLITGEVGVLAGGSCVSLDLRRDQLVAKLNAQLGAGASGFLPWDWVPAAASNCTYDVGPSDPLLAALRTLTP